ncbi:MAG TPA: response regulator [Gemmatimonadales bacterium]|nr:response regulator [Gemmatimonadales bacterium]
MSEARAPRPSRPTLQYQLAGKEDAGSGLLIQVVDDDPDMIKLERTILSGAGYRTTAAFDAMQGMMIAQREQPALIIIDLHMPAGGGLALIKKLKTAQKTAHIPLLVITADQAKGLPEEARALGANEFLLKPVVPEQLLEIVARLVSTEGQ